MNRPRKNKNKSLPINLYKSGKYYRYRHPVTGKYYGMGVNKAEAINAANELNGRLIPQKSLVNKVLGIENISIQRVVDDYYADYTTDKNYSERTLQEIGYRINHIKDWITDTDIKMIDTRMCADFLDTYSGRAYQLHRQQLIDLFKVAVAKGYIKNNPAEQTLTKTTKPKLRKRLTLDQFKLIKAQAEPWLQNAMELSLVTLQRRGDIVLMKFDDIKDGFLWVDQRKGKRHDNKVTRLKIPLELNNLKIVVSQCRDTTMSPFLIHRNPTRRIKFKNQQHWTQVKDEYLSHAFADARDNLKEFKTMKAAEKPTFHEIRSLGADIYREQYGKEFVQTLLGHTTLRMSEHYLEGHKEWTEIKLRS